MTPELSRTFLFDFSFSLPSSQSPRCHVADPTLRHQGFSGDSGADLAFATTGILRVYRHGSDCSRRTNLPTTRKWTRHNAVAFGFQVKAFPAERIQRGGEKAPEPGNVATMRCPPAEEGETTSPTAKT